ncbi:SAM-dependent methyltransferase [uncultured Nocardioides sp.]|uniref:SAM-dependent methyltransferase n=1 Tax=uncultured Nocardioides sp. TaxID=198441 RepID=UPI00261A8D47|nr:SAM-dependent methyltransferase [uncultured Nocardioides sp.]
MPTVPLTEALADVRADLLDADGLLRAVASGRRKGLDAPPWRRVELRWVDLKAGRRLQVTSYDATQAHTANHAVGDEAERAVADLVGTPYGHWNLETAVRTVQLRVTKSGEAAVTTKQREAAVTPDRSHDRSKSRLLPYDDPVLAALGITDAEGRVKPSRQAKLRQVEEFLRLLDATLTEALDAGHLRTPTEDAPLRVADLGCGNAYLTFAAERYLSAVRGLPVALTGVDVKQQSHEHNTELAGLLDARASFAVGTIAGVELDEPPEVVLALHACDTATDEALARAVTWQSAVVLAAPCCHRDVGAQLRRATPPAPYGQLTRHGILRERLADTLTDGLRASLLRALGHRVDVVEFVDPAYTPRSTMLRAVRTGVVDDAARAEHDALAADWGVRPRLAELLGVPGGG